jgi:hypothetical protein
MVSPVSATTPAIPWPDGQDDVFIVEVLGHQRTYLTPPLIRDEDSAPLDTHLVPDDFQNNRCQLRKIERGVQQFRGLEDSIESLDIPNRILIGLRGR